MALTTTSSLTALQQDSRRKLMLCQSHHINGYTVRRCAHRAGISWRQGGWVAAVVEAVGISRDEGERRVGREDVLLLLRPHIVDLRPAC